MARNVALDVVARDHGTSTFDNVADAAERSARRINRTTAKLDVKVDADAVAASAQQAASRIPQIFGNTLGSLPPQVQAAIMTGAIGAAALLAPLIGAAINAGVLLGLGGGVMAAGIALALKDPKVSGAFKALGDRAKKALAPFAEPFKAPLIRAAGTFGDAIERMAPSLTRIGKATAPLIDKLAPALASMAEKALPGIESAIKASAPVFDALAKSLPGLGEDISKFFAMMAKGAPGASTAISHLVKLVGGIVIATGAGIMALSIAYQWIVDTVKSTGEALSAAWEGIKSGASTAWEFLKTGALATWSLIKDHIVKPTQEMWTLLQGVWDAVTATLASIWEGIKSGAATAWAAIKRAIVDPVVSMYNQVKDLFNRARDAVGGALSSAYTKAMEIGSRFLGVGKDIVNGIVQGVKDSASKLYDTLKKLANSALEAAKRTLGINSPSKVFASVVGASIPEGIALGVTRSAAIASQAVRNMSRGLVEAGATAMLTPSLAGAGGASVMPLAGSERQDPRAGATINIYEAHRSGRELAREIDWELRSQGG